MLIKICGVSNYIDAFNAIENGATAIGFVMGGRVLPFEVEPQAQAVRQMIKNFPSHVDSFLVTHLEKAEDIVDLANYIKCSGIQVSENIGPEEMEKVRRMTDKKIIKTVVVSEKEVSLKSLKDYENLCDYILLDTRFAGYTGGTGIINDWELCDILIKESKKPVYIAGGLSPENIKEALEKAWPDGVDVSTGVSEYGDMYLKKDRKSSEKINKFITIAKEAYEKKQKAI